MRQRTGKNLSCANCGESFYVQGCRLKRKGKRAPKYCSMSCRSQIAVVKHGYARRDGAKTPTYISWQTMRNRIKETADARHKRLYFDKGITICRRWNKFKNFLKDMGERPEGLSLERRDNAKGYSPSNCYWADQKAQNRNKRNNRMITYNGKTQCLMAWAEDVGLDESAIRRRLNAGWLIGKALTVPPQKPGTRNPEWRGLAAP